MAVREWALALLVALLFFSAAEKPADATAVDLTGSLDLLHTSSDGTQLPYRLYVPDNLDTNSGNPLILFLHGWGEKGRDNERQLRQAGGLIEAARQYDSFLLAPQVPVGGNWVAETISVVGEILQSTQDSYAVDSGRIYVTGYSMGGFGTLSSMLIFPEVFAAAVPMHSSISPGARGYIDHIPTWGFNGELDVSAERMGELLQVMASAGLADIRYTELAGVGHSGWDDIYRDINQELYPWLFSNEIVATPLPAAAPLLLSALLGLAALRRWRRR